MLFAAVHESAHGT